MSKNSLFAVLLCASGLTLHAQAPAVAEQSAHANKTPFSYQVDIGGMVPAGGAAPSGGYNSSFMIGGGVGLPVKTWLSLDMATLDFGFGTTDQSQTISVSNGTSAKTSNYQMLFSSGPRVNVPLGKSFALGLGGGFGSAVQNEYVPDQVSTIGGVTVIQSVDCTSCSRRAFPGVYAEARLFGRDGKYTSVGIDAKYYLLRGGYDSSSFSSVPAQRWLGVGLTFTFGI